jgi:hypothetical protein
MKHITDYNKFIYEVRTFDDTKDWLTDKDNIITSYSTNGGMQTYKQTWTKEQFNEMVDKLVAFRNTL